MTTDRLAAARLYCDLASQALADNTADATSEARVYLDSAVALLDGGSVAQERAS